MGYRILITEAVNEKGLNYLRDQGYELVMGTGPEEETLLRECHDCDGALTRNGREVDNELMRYRRKMEKTSYIDFTSYKALPMDPVNCFEREQTDYTKADAILKAMHLNEMELAVLNCILRGLVRSEIIAELGIGRGSICYRKRQIRSKYQTYIGFLQ